MRKVFLLVICFLLCACDQDRSVYKEVILDEYLPISSKITLTMVGDALIHSPIYADAYEDGQYNFYKMFESLGSEFLSSDLLYYNQETILGGSSLGYFGYPRFNTPEEFGRTMIDLGFNIVSRANNHTLDKGEAGILNACNFWNKYPHVLTSGSFCTQQEASTPKIMEMNGIRYTLLSYTTSTNGLVSPNDYYVNIYSDEKVKSDVDKIKDDVDILLVAMHWGDECRSVPNDEQIRISEYLADLGIDIVIGTHPHVIEPIRWIDDTLVIYSLGNFISNQSTVNDYARRIGLLVNVDIIKTISGDNIKVELTNLNTSLIYTYSSNNSNFKVVPFNKLDDNILKDYKNLKTKYDSIIKYYDSSIITN